MLGIAGAAAAPLGSLAARPARRPRWPQAAAARLSSARTLPLDVAEWSYMWVNVKRADTARGSFIGGQQMYVEYMVPTRVRKPFPIVLVHGGGGQGLDWMGTPDGRPGWFQYLVAEGYKVYVVDRPGHGRSPQHPDLHGAIPAAPRHDGGAAGAASSSRRAANNPDPYRKNHTQWPGPGVPGAPDVAQFIASQGGSYVVNPPPPGAQRGGRGAVPAGARRSGRRTSGRRAGRSADAGEPAAGRPAEPRAHGVARGGRRAARQDRSRDHHDALGRRPVRPARRRGAAEPREGDRHHRRRRLRLRRRQPLGHVDDSGDLRSAGRAIRPRSRRAGSRIPEPDVDGYFLQEEPARKLPNLRDVAVLIVTAAGVGTRRRATRAAPAFLKQAGVQVAEELRLAQRRHPRQQPHDDGREEPSRGAAADPRLAGQERHAAARRPSGSAAPSRPR